MASFQKLLYRRCQDSAHQAHSHWLASSFVQFSLYRNGIQNFLGDIFGGTVYPEDILYRGTQYPGYYVQEYKNPGMPNILWHLSTIWAVVIYRDDWLPLPVTPSHCTLVLDDSPVILPYSAGWLPPGWNDSRGGQWTLGAIDSPPLLNCHYIYFYKF